MLTMKAADIKSLNQSGFTIIETAAAMIILSIGLLAIAYLQTTSMQYVQASFHRSQSNTIVADMMDRMRSNLVAASHASSINYTNTITTEEYTATTCPLNPGTTATPRTDTICFYKSLIRSLPNGNMQIGLSDLDGDLIFESYNITIYWSDRQLSQGNLSTTSETGKIQQADCIGTNRIWSGSLSWPGVSDPAICLISHSWNFQVMDRT